LRSATIEAFRDRGILPREGSLPAEESLIWPGAPKDIPVLAYEKMQWANEIALAATAYSLDPFEMPEEDQADLPGMRSFLGKGGTDYGGFSSDDERELKSDLASGLWPTPKARRNACFSM